MSGNITVVKEKKASIIQKQGKSATNTGTAEVQVALLSDRIVSLTEHLKKHKKDFSTQRGLMKMVGQRRRLLDYLKINDSSRYLKLLSDLDLRK